MIVLECWCVVVMTVDVWSVKDNWHVRELDLGEIDLNTRNLEIFRKKSKNKQDKKQVKSPITTDSQTLLKLQRKK